MNLRTFLIAGISVLLGLGLALVTVGSPPENANAMNPTAGRYTVVSHAERIWLIDSATGEGWSTDPSAATSQPPRWSHAIGPRTK